MGIYLNPGNYMFQEAKRSDIFVDKTEMIGYVNKMLGTNQKYMCISRPHRFGKTMAANMLCALLQAPQLPDRTGMKSKRIVSIQDEALGD